MQHLIGHNPKLMLCKGSEGKTPLHTACKHGQTEVVKILIQNLTTLIEISDTNLLEGTDANGNTPLHLACVGGNVTIVQLLVDHGASIIGTNSKGEAPIHTAAQHKSVDVMKLLLDKGDHTMIELKDDCGCTPLHHSAEKNQSGIITFLYGW